MDKIWAKIEPEMAKQTCIHMYMWAKVCTSEWCRVYVCVCLCAATGRRVREWPAVCVINLWHERVRPPSSVSLFRPGTFIFHLTLGHSFVAGVLVRRAMGKGHRERTWHRQLNCEPLAKDDYDFPPNYVFFNLHDELVWVGVVGGSCIISF